MAKLLDFSQYLGGPDNVEVIEMFPRQQKRFVYNFGANVSTYTFSADYQTIVLDAVTYDRATSNIVFTDTNVIGYFNNTGNIAANTYINTSSANSGIVEFTIPSDLYTGTIMPNARENVVMNVVSFQWQDATTPPRKDMHRWAIVMRWEPGVTIGDPTLDTNFVKMGVGSIAAFTSNAATAAARVAGTYTVTGLPSKNGTGATFQVVVGSGGATSIKITGRGTGYLPSETITILDSTLGGGGAADILITVSSTI
jgi:hypothetical protein